MKHKGKLNIDFTLIRYKNMINECSQQQEYQPNMNDIDSLGMNCYFVWIYSKPQLYCLPKSAALE